MGYELIRNGSTEYAVDFDIVDRLLRSYHRAYQQYYNSSEESISDSHWYNPMTWSLPEITHLEVDWRAVRERATGYAKADGEEFRKWARYDVRGMAYRLVWIIDQTARYKELFLDRMGQIQTDNMQNINQAVKDYGDLADTARFVRDTCADGLMIGGTVLTGGTGLAVLGGASFFKGYAKFQDTGSVGGAVMEGAGSFVFAYVKLGKSFSFKQDMVLALIQGVYKTGTELVSGASVGKAVLTGSLKLSGPAVNRFFTNGPVQKMFDKVSVPLWVTVKSDWTPGRIDVQMADRSAAYLSRETAKFVQGRLIEKTGRDAIYNKFAGPGVPGSSPPPRRSAVLDDATLTNKLLLDFAIVNMANGIARGW